ncbi:MAG TPA: cation:proton antiporter [Fimbriimonas sp.]|nr:cation:proton antiporter [Fimbriimonas sp.]
MLKTLGLYGLITVGFLAAMGLVLFAGQGLGSGPSHSPSQVDPFAALLTTLHAPLSQLLMQVVVIVSVARLVGALFQRFGQPAVVGEMFAGVALGPSLLGGQFPQVARFVFPSASLGNLNLLSQVGIVLFMFVVGMELDTRLLRQKANTAVLVSHSSIFVPFLFGLSSALFLFKGFAGQQGTFLPFALFIGISMSITAFPVLARILRERHMTGTQLGNTAITCAAVDDITAWCSLAFIVAISKAQSLAGSVLTLVLSATFVAIALGLLRPLLQRMVARLEDPSKPGANAVVTALVSVFACALFTEAIGIHALFGAFVAGIAMPKEPEFREFLTERLEYFSTLFLLPIFFAYTGLRTQVGLLNGPADWLTCLYLLFIAVAGKFGASALASKATGLNWKESIAIGALMNTRGLMELIALNLGLDLGVLSPKIFAMLVLMALVTTFTTGPVLTRLGFGQRKTAASGGNSALEGA